MDKSCSRVTLKEDDFKVIMSILSKYVNISLILSRKTYGELAMELLAILRPTHMELNIKLLIY